MVRDIRAYERSIEEANPEFVGAFEIELRSEGGRLSPRDELFQWFCLRYWDYIQTFRRLPIYAPYLKRFHFDFVANEHLNAVATSCKDIYFIGLNAGAIQNLEIFFSLLFSDPRILADIGNASKETPWIENLTRCDWRLPVASILQEVSLRARPPQSFPIDPERRLYAHRLAILAADFVFFHELGHLVNGHLEFLGSSG